MRILLERSPIIAMLLACAVISAQGNTVPFTLSVEAEQNVVNVGSEVKVNVTLRNSSNRPIYISMGSSEIDYQIDARDSQGGLVPGTAFAQELKTRPYYSSDTVLLLQPGESLPKTALSVTKFYALDRPGKYVIQVSRTVPKEAGGGLTKSNKITITIVQDKPN